MAEEFKIIQMYNSTGTQVFPKTKADIVAYDDTTSVKDKIAALVTAGGEPNVLEAVKWNGTAFTITDKAVDIYEQVSTFVSTEIGKQIHMNVQVVTELPETGVSGVIYLIAHTGTGTAAGTGGTYDEYIWTGTAFELIGTTAVDLTGYATETFVSTAISNKVTELGLDNLANTYAAKAATEAHIANGDIHVTAGQKAAWDAKQAALTEAQIAAVNSGINATKVAAYDAYSTGKQDALTTEQLAAVNSGITATKVAAYDAYTAVERYSKTEADAMAEGKAEAAIEALDLANTYAAKSYEARVEANETNKADKTITIGGQTLSVLYFEEEVTA